MATSALAATLRAVLEADDQLRQNGEHLRTLAAGIAARLKEADPLVRTRLSTTNRHRHWYSTLVR